MPTPKRRRFLIRLAQKKRAKRKKVTHPLTNLEKLVGRKLDAALESRAKAAGVGARIPKSSPAILGVGGAQLVVDLGRARIGGKVLPVVAKLFLEPKQSASHHSVWFAERKPMEIEATALFLQKQGLPVVMHSAVPYKGRWVMVSENLQAGGNKMFEAFDFDFSRLKNGQELRNQFNQLTLSLLKLEGEGLLRLDRHIKADTGGPHEGEERIFYVVQDAKTRLGRLVVADLDHIKLESKAWNQFRTVFAPIRKKFNEPDGHML